MRALGAWLALMIVCAAGHTAPLLEKVLDGDTVIIRDQAHTYHLRLLDIDAPELQQPFGRQSRRNLADLCEHARITVDLQGQDIYGRTLGHLYCAEIDASQSQVAQGFAWFNQRYSQRQALAGLQRQAQARGHGLWQQHQPMPPWIWRKRYGRHYRHQE